jgi:hypothetical protein
LFFSVHLVVAFSSIGISSAAGLSHLQSAAAAATYNTTATPKKSHPPTREKERER